MKYITTIMMLTVTVLFLSCRDFLTDEQAAELRNFEKRVYVLEKNVRINDQALMKGEKIKVHVHLEADSIRLRAYRADEDPLEADRLLILYMFEDEFPDKKFDKDIFMKRFNRIARPR